ncbi:MAG: hypothetical protein ACREIQ_10690 [Nitrospiria bacterium]
MRPINIALIFAGLIHFVLAAGFFSRQAWATALGPLLGFLVYDLVLFGPLFARYGSLKPEHMRGQVAATLIIIFSAALGIHYLFVNPETRLGAPSRSSL